MDCTYGLQADTARAGHGESEAEAVLEGTTRRDMLHLPRQGQVPDGERRCSRQEQTQAARLQVAYKLSQIARLQIT